jgi:hypothetical protein
MREAPNRILEFLTAPAQPSGNACRSNRRRRSTARVELAWLEGNTWRSTPARLRDIGRGGVALIARRTPPLTRHARLRFVEGDGSPWIEAEVVGIEPESPKRRRVRLRFDAPCPSFLLQLAILDVDDPDDEAIGARHEWVAWKEVGSE